MSKTGCSSMSRSLISRSPDLTRLQDEGYEVEVRAGYLLVHSVPYINDRGETAFGTLVSDLTLAGEVTTTPGSHVAHFVGDHPCDLSGKEITQIKHQSVRTELASDLVTSHSFSNKPAEGYRDYHHKMSRYIEIISAPPCLRDSSLTAKTFAPVPALDDDSVFQYEDTASSRANIRSLSSKLAKRVAIVGLGGTGSYVLDQLAKTPATDIALFDGDTFLQHNAFRAPGAPSVEELRQKVSKVDYFKGIYSKMHKKIHAHHLYLHEKNLDLLRGFDVVFICVDKGHVRKMIVEELLGAGVPFIDAGLGVELIAERAELVSVCRVTTMKPSKNNHIHRLPLSDREDDDLYKQNIQIADLNALNALLAVLKWKKMCGFYADEEGEHHATYSTSMNLLTSDEIGT